MASIDERVVEMKFRRDDFLKGTEETLGALARLEEGILGAGGIADGIKGIESRFSTVGTIGLGALASLGAAAVNAGTKITQNIIDPIFTGGKNRALNLEQANFQLTNILKDGDKVAAVMSDVSYAVDGTAYGLDAAAVAAAQFAASGMQAGDDMKAALRGISGVASMGGASYEQVSSIFTKVAGQGRAMGDDLNRLGALGINGAVALANYFDQTGRYAGATEAIIRKMATEGEISFSDFAKAMDSAFGEDAKKANELYSGSLANVKSALARIGAPIFTIEHEKMRRVFNALRPVINAFQKSLDPVYSTYEALIALPVAQAFENWSASMEGFNWPGVAAIIRSLIELGAEFVDVVLSWVRPIGEAFGVIFSNAPNGSWLETANGLIEGLTRGVGGLKATEDQANAVRGVFEFLLTAVRGFVDFIIDGFEFMAPVIQKVWDVFQIGIDYVQEAFEYLRPHVEELFEYLFGVGSPLRNFWEDFRAEVEESGSVFIAFGDLILGLYDTYLAPIVDSLTNLKDVLIAVKDEGFSGLAGRIKEAVAPLQELWDWLGAIKDRLVESFDWNQGPIGAIKAEFPSIREVLKTFFDWVVEGFEQSGPILDTVFGSLREFFSGMGAVLGDFASGLDLEDLDKIRIIIGQIFMAILLYKTLESVKGSFDSVTGFFKSLTTAVTDFNDRANLAAKGSAFLMVAGGLGIIAAALWLIALIPTDKLLGAVLALVAIGGVMTGFVVALDMVEGGKLASTGFGLGLLAGALLGMAAVLIVLGMIPYDVLIQGGIALGIMLAAVTASAAVLGKYAVSMPATAFGLGLLAGALILLIIPLKQLGEMDPAVLYQGGIALGLLLAAVTASAAVLGKFGLDLLLGAIGLAAIAGALNLMVVPIQQIGSMDYAVMDQGLRGVATALLVLVGAALIMQGLGAGAVGVIALSVALVILAFGINQLANIPFQAAGFGILLLAGALAVMVIAGGAATAVLPGLLGLAALVVAFGLAAMLAGVGALLFAVAIRIVGAALPSTTAALINFALVVPLLALAMPAMVALGVGLATFGAGALIAGIGSVILGGGLSLLGIGMALVSRHAGTAAPALLSFVEAILPLVWQVPKLAILTAAIGALGGAMILIGSGMALAGAGGIILGIGAIAAGVGIGVLMLIGAAVAPLVDRIVVSFSKLAPIVPGIASFANAVVMVGAALILLAARSDGAAESIVGLIEAMKRLFMVFDSIGPAASRASTAVAIAMMGIAVAIGTNATTIQAGTEKIEQAFENLISGVTSMGPRISGASAAMIMSMSSQLSKGAAVVMGHTGLIILAFALFAVQIAAQGKLAGTNTQAMITGVNTPLTTGQTTIANSLKAIATEFGKLPAQISQNGRAIATATGGVVTSINNVLSAGKYTVYTLASAVGTAITNGMAAGIRNGKSSVTIAASGVARAALDAANNTLGIRSPSKRAYEMMEFFVQGGVNALRDGIPATEKASSTAATSMMEAFRRSIDDMSSLVDTDLIDFTPTIRPVLDLDQVRRQAPGINGLFDVGIDPTFNRGQATSSALLEEALAKIQGETAVPVTKKYEFKQYNNSPKALSSSEIYRNTKNLISVADREEES